MSTSSHHADVRGRGADLQRKVLLFAAALSFAIVGYHVAGGTPQVMVPVYAANFPINVVSVLDAVWYEMALLFVVGGVGMVVAAYRVEWRGPLAWFIGGHYLALSVMLLVLSFIWFGNPWGLIQWVIFAAVALIVIWAARR